ncbi:MAG: hypothetical protein KC777_17360 [Cyanobacteria bacterium HKST-UBA02]|nr:hypothetical protein [Cyanobacteria bacterium HKST-UBA02]
MDHGFSKKTPDFSLRPTPTLRHGSTSGGACRATRVLEDLLGTIGCQADLLLDFMRWPQAQFDGTLELIDWAKQRSKRAPEKSASANG